MTDKYNLKLIEGGEIDLHGLLDADEAEHHYVNAYWLEVDGVERSVVACNESTAQWLDSKLNASARSGATGGKSKSEKKTAAVKANGKLGGRPRRE